MICNGKSAGHKVYHSRFFNHRSPLSSEQDYTYYQRCCERFLNLIYSTLPITFLITLINEPKKRSSWATGFNYEFPMPTGQNLDHCLGLIRELQNRNKNCQFIIVDHYTQSTR